MRVVEANAGGMYYCVVPSFPIGGDFNMRAVKPKEGAREQGRRGLGLQNCLAVADKKNIHAKYAVQRVAMRGFQCAAGCMTNISHCIGDDMKFRPPPMQ